LSEKLSETRKFFCSGEIVQKIPLKFSVFLVFIIAVFIMAVNIATVAIFSAKTKKIQETEP